MNPIRLLATAVLATGVLSLAQIAEAAPGGVGAGLRSGQIVKVEHRSGDREEWRRWDGVRDGRSDGRDRDYRTWDRDRDWGRDSRRESRRDDDRGDRRRIDRNDRRDDWRWRDQRQYFDYNGHHRGWTKPVRWRVERHPRRNYWVGRQLPYNRFFVVYDYDNYYLPPPRRGHYYARIDNDVYLVAAATRSIIDVFLLFGAVGR